jgi:hypothetical protein
MKRFFAVAAMLLAVSMVAGCIIEASVDHCWDDGTCVAGASCDYVNDQFCVNRTQAWWCSPDGRIYLNDCVTQCTGLAPYACCGYDPGRGDDACLCCMASDCSGLACEP